MGELNAMGTTEEFVRQGKLDEAVASLQAEVRKAPADPKLRVLLFQLFTLTGDWKRAATQLDVLKDLDAKTGPMVQTYGMALQCERFRSEVFSGARTPLVLGEPPQWAAFLLECLKLSAEGHHAEAAALRQKAFDLAPAVSGSVNGEPFQWIADADTRLGPMLEAIINGKYYWLPLGNLKAIHVEAPTDLRDFAWTPAQLTFANGGESVAFIPTRYPGSEGSSDPAIRMARKTEWLEREGGLWCGLGQRVFATDANEYSLLDVRAIEMNVSAAPAAASETASADG